MSRLVLRFQLGINHCLVLVWAPVPARHPQLVQYHYTQGSPHHHLSSHGHYNVDRPSLPTPFMLSTLFLPARPPPLRLSRCKIEHADECEAKSESYPKIHYAAHGRTTPVLRRSSPYLAADGRSSRKTLVQHITPAPVGPDDDDAQYKS